MTKRKAIAEARKRWGARAAVQYNRHASLTLGRREASASLEAMEPRPEEPKDLSDWKRRRTAMTYTALAIPYSVGYVNTVIVPFFSVQGQGDTWEEAFAQADKRRHQDEEQSAAAEAR